MLPKPQMGSYHIFMDFIFIDYVNKKCVSINTYNEKPKIHFNIFFKNNSQIISNSIDDYWKNGTYKSVY